MKTFNLSVASPSGNIFEGEATGIYLRGASGDLAVLADHAPFVTSVVPCKGKIEDGSGEEKPFEIERGLLTVSKEKVILMSGSFKWL
ncbi:MAG: F0F1 ATP synthase subunit epsilon [Clostridia bacterium]|nr:F0F1 ATP synthase subunit epsilon [Clostridia bacterium]